MTKLGIFLVPEAANARLTACSDPAELLEALENCAVAAEHVESISLELSWNLFTEDLAKSARQPWDRMTPTERQRAAQTFVDATPPSRRGGFETALAEVLARNSDNTAGLWVQEEPEEPEGEVVSPEESVRRLREHIERSVEAKLRQGAGGGTELVLRLLEVPGPVITKARKLVQDDLDVAEGTLVDEATVQAESQTIGEHEAVQRLLALVPAGARAVHDLYTPAAARDLLAAIEELQAKHGGEAKLAAVLLEDPDDSSLALQALKWFKAALRRGVARKHGFAVVTSTTLL